MQMSKPKSICAAAAELPKAAKHLAMLKARWAKKSKPKEQVGEKVQETSMDLATFERVSLLPHICCFSDVLVISFVNSPEFSNVVAG
jgi:hypothetical protein